MASHQLTPDTWLDSDHVNKLLEWIYATEAHETVAPLQAWLIRMPDSLYGEPITIGQAWEATCSLGRSAAILAITGDSEPFKAWQRYRPVKLSHTTRTKYPNYFVSMNELQLKLSEVVAALEAELNRHPLTSLLAAAERRLNETA